jgi:predicted secreted protein
VREKQIFALFVISLVTVSAFVFTDLAEADLGLLMPIEISATCDDFRFNNHITESVKLGVHGQLEITLCSNPSTGYQWPESAEISDPTVLWQIGHTSLAGGSGAMGAPGQERWTFQALREGKSTISLQYGRPWEGTGADNWTFQVNVTVISEEKDQEDKSTEQIGEELVRKLFTDIKNSNVSAIEKYMSESFQSVHDFGASNREEELNILKGIELEVYELTDFRGTRHGDVLIVTYKMSAQETIEGKKLSLKPIPRLSVFVKTESGWEWLAHANLG